MAGEGIQMEQSSPKAGVMTRTEKKKNPTSRPRVVRRLIRRRDAMDAAQRFKTYPDGSVKVIRFTLGQRIEHMVLIISFTGLAVTGLAQTYYETLLGSFILALFGGIVSIRSIHHLFAFVFGIQSIYHAALFVYELFVFRRTSRIMPDFDDVRNLFEMLALNLGLSKRHPRFDRYNFEEKAEYWALVWGTVIMGITGLMQWFPVMVAEVLPGWIIPVARAFHRWEAILAVLAILTWHTYHAVLKTRNTSIFTGLMSLEQIQEEHPLELLYLEKATESLHSQTWPVLIEIPVDEPKKDVEPEISLEKETENPLEVQYEKPLEEIKISLEKEIEVPDGDSKIIA